MTAFLHKARFGTCRAVLFYRPAGITRNGPVHQLAVVCDEAVHRPGASWCAAHAAGLYEPSRTPLAAPAERRVIPARAAERTPDLVEELT